MFDEVCSPRLTDPSQLWQDSHQRVPSLPIEAPGVEYHQVFHGLQC